MYSRLDPASVCLPKDGEMCSELRVGPHKFSELKRPRLTGCRHTNTRPANISIQQYTVCKLYTVD